MKKRKLVAFILTIAMILSMIPIVGAAGATIEPAPATVKITRTKYSSTTLAKKATYDIDWMNNKETEVTLSVSSKATKTRPPVLIEFVLDATESFWLDIKFREVGLNPVGELKKALSDKNVYTGVTLFASKAQSVGDLTATKLSTANPELAYEQIINTATKLGETAYLEDNVGTNMQVGIHAGLQNLRARRAAMSEDPVASYLILISDGGSFYYYEDEIYDDAHLVGDTNEAADPGLMVTVDRLADLMDSPDKANTNFEKAVLASAKVLDELDDDVELLTIGMPYYSDSNIPTLTALAADVMQYAADKSIYNMILEQETFDAREAATLIGKVANEVEDALLYSLSAGTTLTDVIGSGTDNLGKSYDFDLLLNEPIYLKVGSIEMSGTLQDNKLSFQHNGLEYAVLEYHPGELENFVLTFKRPIRLKDAVSLRYKAVLDSPNVSRGTHVVATNDIAYVVPLSRAVNPSKLPVTGTLPEDVGAMEFLKPTLGYVADGNRVIPYNPSTEDIGRSPESIPELNTKDHYGYIIGYPVDYQTGAHTNYQPRMPVRPEALITRAEVATIYFRMLTDASREALWEKKNPYTDVPETAWFDAAISTLTKGGILRGGPSGKFRPNDPITRAEFATIATRFFGGSYSGEDLFPDISGHWAQAAINLAATDGLINGYTDGTFRPDQNILRCEAIAIVNRTLNRHPVKEHFLPDMLIWPDNMNTSKWYYADMQEATNSHDYDMIGTGDDRYEIWTKILPIRDWVQFERIWSDAHSALNPGEVVNKDR